MKVKKKNEEEKQKRNAKGGGEDAYSFNFTVWYNENS